MSSDLRKMMPNPVKKLEVHVGGPLSTGNIPQHFGPNRVPEPKETTQRPAAWQAFRRLGMPESLLQVLPGLQEHTIYQCRGRHSLWEEYIQTTGFSGRVSHQSYLVFRLPYSFPLKDFDQRCSENVLLHSLPNKTFNLRMPKQVRQIVTALGLILSLLSSADDATMVSPSCCFFFFFFFFFVFNVFTCGFWRQWSCCSICPSWRCLLRQIWWGHAAKSQDWINSWNGGGPFF